MSVADSGAREEALDPLHSFCVSAPAGSGKTELLIQRFLVLLARVDRPEQILAITFTRKAAAEMKSRIARALAAADAGTPCGGAHEQVTRDHALVALERGRSLGWELQRDVSRLNIRTIDSFCAALTRQMPVLSQFGGQAPTVEAADEFYAEAVAELFDLVGSEQPVAEDLRQLLLHFDNDWERLRRLLVNMLARREQWQDYLGVHHTAAESEARLLATVESLVADALGAVAERLAPWEDQLLDLLCYSLENQRGEPPADFPAPGAPELATWLALRAMLLTNEGNWRKRLTVREGFPSGKGEPIERKAHLERLIGELAGADGLREQLEELAWLPRMGDNTTSWLTVLQLSHVLPYLAACLLLVFQRRGVVDHNQVALSALQALGDDDDPTDLALRLDYRIEHILVDEFQDTAINQYRLVERLTRGWREYNEINPGRPRTVFIVGDGMQSIYGFRDANVGLFLRARDNGFNGVLPRPLALSCNFRSAAGLVHWVNESFARAFPEQDDERCGQVSFTAATPVRQAGPGPAVELHGFCGEAAQHQEAGLLLERVREGLADPEVDSIAILGRSRAHLAPVLARLRAGGIPFAAQEMDRLSGTPVIVDLMSLCRALANPADRVAWLSLLRAPWCGLTLADLHALAAPPVASLRQLLATPANWPPISPDGRRRLAHVAAALAWAGEHRDRLALRVWVEQAWLRLGGAATAGEQGLQDAERFFELLAEAENEGVGLDIDWLKARLERLFAVGTGPEAKLQVMTLHKAKGLEFDWVFIPALARGTRSDSRELLLWDEYVDGEGERGFLLAADDLAGSGEPTLYNFLKRRRNRKERLENTRLLYVGATRAANRLLLSASLNAEEETDGIAPRFRPPADGTLLAPIWETFEQQMLYHPPADMPDPEGAGAVGSLRRLRRLPETVASRGPATASAENVPAPPLNRLERLVGTVVHMALEELSRLQVLPGGIGIPEQARWRHALRSLGLEGSLLDRAYERVSGAVQRVLDDRAAGRWLLSSSHAEAHSELPLTRVDSDGVVRDIVVDRTFLDRETGIRWVVDYKTSTPLAGERLADFAAREAALYREQLEGYRDALASLGPQPIRCALYFTGVAYLHTYSDL